MQRAGWVRLMTWAAALACALLAIAPLMGGADPRLDALTHAAPYVMCFCALIAFACARLSAPRAGALAASAAFLSGLSAFPPFAFAPSTPTPTPTGDLRVAFQNVLHLNADAEALTAAIRASDADVVALVEAANPAGYGAASALRDRYPHQIFAFPFGERFILLSRYPLRWSPPSGADVKLTLADVSTPQGAFRLGVTHTFRPWPFQPPERQGRALAAIAAEANAFEGPFVLVGDFNAVPRSAVLRRFARDGGLTRGRNPLGTWPHPLPAALRITIDHGFAGGGARIVSTRLMRPAGSDHRGLVMDVALTRPDAPATSTPPSRRPPPAPS